MMLQFAICLSFALPLFATFVDNISYSALHQHVQSTPALLFITVRWCDHCNALNSEIKHLAKQVASNSDILVARADGDEQPGVAAAFSVRGYPTILYIPAGDTPEQGAMEFGDYRWAEIMAEFVNNETQSQVLTMAPREAFLRWRKKNPYNRGSIQMEWEQQDDAMPDEVLEGIREPTRLKEADFDQVYEKGMRYMVLFYSEYDPMLREILVQWRQASSAFTGADNVTISIVDVDSEEQIGKRLGIEDTPRCLYFGDGEPLKCDDELDETENIIQFIADQVMKEMGINGPKLGQPYHLTEEEYKRLKTEGKVFANDDSNEDSMRQIYNQLAKDEL